MHFAMPPRKTSRPPPYAARQQSGLRIPPALKNLLRKDRLRLVVLGILGFLTVFWLLGRIGGGSKASAPSLPKVAIGSGAPVVIVTVLDPNADTEWTEKIKQNREVYAKKHGMAYSQTKLEKGSINVEQATKPSSLTTTNTPSATHRQHGPAFPPCAMP